MNAKVKLKIKWNETALTCLRCCTIFLTSDWGEHDLAATADFCTDLKSGHPQYKSVFFQTALVFSLYKMWIFLRRYDSVKSPDRTNKTRLGKCTLRNTLIFHRFFFTPQQVRWRQHVVYLIPTVQSTTDLDHSYLKQITKAVMVYRVIVARV
jgi:hypothetical protein